MIATLAGTMAVESCVIFAFAKVTKKSLLALLVTGCLANSLTQSILWAALLAFPTHYLLTLSIVEVLILGIEFLLFYLNGFAELRWNEALFLSFSMNLASFAIGWFLQL